jgi:hypothetical protein
LSEAPHHYLTITILPMHPLDPNSGPAIEEKLRPPCRISRHWNFQDDISPRTRPQAQPGAAALQQVKRKKEKGKRSAAKAGGSHSSVLFPFTLNLFPYCP